jgi:hypothetical protein
VIRHNKQAQRRQQCPADFTLAAIALVVLALAGSAQADPLQAHRDRDALVEALGIPPESCYPSGVNTRLCTWRIEGGAAAVLLNLPQGGESFVLCDLPLEPAQRERGSCSVHGPVSGGAQAKRPTRAQRSAALEQLESARAFSDLARLVGNGPTDCASDTLTTWTCMWLVTRMNTGYTILSHASGSNAEPLRLVCHMPIEGMRVRGSCRFFAAR